METLARRDFIGLIAAALASGAVPRSAWASEANPYTQSIVIDCLASPTSFNVPYPKPGPLTVEQLKNVRDSGITAINLTVSGDDLAKTIKQIGFYLGEIERHPDLLMLIRRHADIATAKREGKLGLILGFQGMTMIGDDISLIDAFADIPVKIMQLTYNDKNRLGAGSSFPDTEGLSPFGRDVVARLNALHVVVDLAHSNPQTARDANEASSRPIIISHTGCRAINMNQRCMPDDVLRAVANKGGVVGMFLMPFLGKDPVSPSKALFMRHLEHALQICGEDHVGIGTDQSITPIDPTPAYMDAVRSMAAQRQAQGIGAPGEADVPVMTPELNSPRRLELIAAEMLKAGHPTRVVEKVIGGNFSRLFREEWQA